MNSLPTELNLKILHHFRDSDPDAPFAGHSGFSIAHGEEYNAFLLRMALYHRHWTALAQAELFHYILLKDADKTRLLLKLLKKRGNGVFRTYAEKTPIIRLGYYTDRHEWDDLKDHLEKLAEYCPNIAEIWCTSVNTKLSDFRELFSSHAEAKLIKLGIAHCRTFQEARQAVLRLWYPRWIRLILAVGH